MVYHLPKIDFDRCVSRAIAFLALLAFASGAQTVASRYSKELATLDLAKPESVCRARDSLRVLILRAGPDERAAMFRGFRTFYLQAVSDTEPMFWEVMKPFKRDTESWIMQSDDPDPVQALLRSRPDIRKAGAIWFKCGFAVTEGEGDLYPAADSSTLLEFASKLPPDLESYVRFRAKEDAQAIWGDATPQLTWEQLRLRLERWEGFARDNPDLLETKSEVMPGIHSLAGFYFFGIDNTPTFDFEGGRVRPDVVASWRMFAAQDQASKYHSLTTRMLAGLDKDHGKVSEQDRVLFQQYGLGTEFDNWWRGYLLFTAEHRAH
jgi:hypothetical protein